MLAYSPVPGFGRKKYRSSMPLNSALQEQGGRKQLKLEKVNLTERDVTLLKTLGRCGILTLEQVRKLYGNVSRYHLRRVELLRSAGYISRKDGCVTVTAAGLRAAGAERPQKMKSAYKERRIAVMGVLLGLPGWHVELGAEAKKARGMNRGSRVDAVVSDGSKEYAVYVLPPEPKRVAVARLYSEIAVLPRHRLERAAVFAPTPEAFDTFLAGGGSSAKKLLLEGKTLMKELLLLPSAVGPDIIAKVNAPAFVDLLFSAFPGAVNAGRMFADYLWRSCYLTLLLTNDLLKRELLRHYLEGPFYKAEGSPPIIVVCLESQVPVFSAIYPGVSFAVVDDDIAEFIQLPKGVG